MGSFLGIPSNKTNGSCGWMDPQKLNQLTSKRVAEIATYVFLTCAVAITVCASIVLYPAVSSAFFTTFTLIAIGSLLTLAISLSKHQQIKKPSLPTNNG